MFYIDTIYQYYIKNQNYGFDVLEGDGFRAIRGPYNMPYLHLVFGKCTSEDGLQKIKNFFGKEPYCWFVTDQDDKNFINILISNGCRFDGSDPMMLLDLKDYNLSLNAPVDIQIVHDKKMLEEWAKIAEIAYDLPMEGLYKFAAIAAKENRRDIKVFIGYSDGKPVACSMVHIGDNTAAIYWVGVLKEYRNRGIGSDMTKICIEYAKEQNLVKQISLQAFPAGVGSYQKLGFKNISQLDYYWSE